MAEVLKLPTKAEVAEMEGRTTGAIRRRAAQEDAFWAKMASRREVREMVNQAVSQALQRVGSDLGRLVAEVSAVEQLMLDDGLLTPERLQHYRRVANGLMRGMPLAEARAAAEAQPEPPQPPTTDPEPEGGARA